MQYLCFWVNRFKQIEQENGFSFFAFAADFFCMIAVTAAAAAFGLVVIDGILKFGVMDKDVSENEGDDDNDGSLSVNGNGGKL